jgi:hypothetical protein
MKNLVNVSVLLGIVVLIMLLVVASAGASSLQVGLAEGEIEPEVEPEVEPGGEGEVEPEAGAAAEADPEGAALRINFVVGGHTARRGLYVVQTPGGGEIASWYALDGWEDSGWISNLEIGRETVWVEVLYYPGPDTVPTVMRILNHAPDTTYGWVSQGMGHALEVAWPDQPLMFEEASDFSDGGL